MPCRESVRVMELPEMQQAPVESGEPTPIDLRGQKRAMAMLLVYAIVALVFEVLAMPTLTPPGRVFGPFDVAAGAVLIWGAWTAAHFTRAKLPFTVFGAFGGITFGTYFLYELGRPYNYDPLWIQIIPFCAFVAASSFVCRGVATIRWRVDDRRAAKLRDRCLHCGYLLYGLTAKRCPECGEPFQQTIPTAAPRPAKV